MPVDRGVERAEISHSMLVGEDFAAFESLMAAQRVKRGSGHDDNWRLIMAFNGTDEQGRWTHTTGVFQAVPPDEMTRSVPLGWAEMDFSEDGQALPNTPLGDERRRTIAALARTATAHPAALTQSTPTPAAPPAAVRRTR
ncbi:hypothetical protein ACFVT9_28110 [Kitasatospora cineracea]|uniref:hypothetical protein n=1 Tax=Kitasatospora cineracea TaxID=88074 RepID=UPI0036D835A6